VKYKFLTAVSIMIAAFGDIALCRSDYGLDDRAIEVRSHAGENNFCSSLCVQTGSEDHPASCTMGTGGTSPGAKALPRRDIFQFVRNNLVFFRMWLSSKFHLIPLRVPDI
jgi:hypothetical protein